MPRTRFAAAAAAVGAAILLAPAAGAGSTSIAIGTVDGETVGGTRVHHPLSGDVTVTGTADTGTPPPAATAQPLVADAGDTPWVAAGERAVLVGVVHGGTAPYTYQWTSPAGALTGADGSSAELDTTGVAPGTYEVGFTVRDAAGAEAADTVLVVVHRGGIVLLEAQQDDRLPGVFPVGGSVDFNFDVPPGLRLMDIVVRFSDDNDYDLHVLDPEGEERDLSGNGATNGVLGIETSTIEAPEPGTWTLAVERFATVPPDTISALVTAPNQDPDPRPAVSAGGPYSFLVGEPQQVAGTITGGTGDVQAAWDLDDDGVFETPGTEASPQLPPGRHLVTLKATDAAGHERRQATTVLVGDAERLARESRPFAVIGIADTGINPYHLEFSASTYPDPDVLALTNGFTRHPSEYIPGYPRDAEALPITLGAGYFPPEDADLWTPERIKEGRLYWIPGTKIVGAWDSGSAAGLQEALVEGNPDSHPILDDNGHGSGSASVAAGNRYGYCPTCLLVIVESLDETVATQMPWVDITSHSFGYVGGLPLGLLLGPNEPTRDAAERGQTVLFAAGNGVGNAFDVPIATYGSDQTGPDWNITVGALRRDNQRAVVGDGIPVHLSSWGDGNLPSACRTGTVGQCAFGGTSAATPYTAGVFGTVLSRVRGAMGDEGVGQRPGQVVADGVAYPDSVYLDDGVLTRAELRDAVLRTAEPLDGEVSPFPYPLTAPRTGVTDVLFEGYGAATPNSAARAVDVLLGEAMVPEREVEDAFFAVDRVVRDTLYGGYDRDGDGEDDFEGLAGGATALGVTAEDVATVDGALRALGAAAAATAASTDAAATGAGTLTYYLHRRVAAEPDEPPVQCDPEKNESYMDGDDTPGDLEPCFESRVTSVAAAYRPLGIFASTGVLDAPLPAGSTVTVDLFIAGETPAVVRPTGVLMATDREIGEGPGSFVPVFPSGPGGAGCAAMGESCWSHSRFSFETTRPAFAGEQLTFQVQLVGARSWAFGFEGEHASRITIDVAPVPPAGFEFGVDITEPAGGSTVDGGTVVVGGTAAFPDQGDDPTGAGDHPVRRRVVVSVDDASFADPVPATLDEESGTWSAPLDGLEPGTHTVYARAEADRSFSAADAVTFTVTEPGAARVEWQVVNRNGAPADAAWRPASGTAQWSFAFTTADYGTGPKTIVVRIVQGGAETGRDTVKARFE